MHWPFSPQNTSKINHFRLKGFVYIARELLSFGSVTVIDGQWQFGVWYYVYEGSSLLARIYVKIPDRRNVFLIDMFAQVNFFKSVQIVVTWTLLNFSNWYMMDGAFWVPSQLLLIF